MYETKVAICAIVNTSCSEVSFGKSEVMISEIIKTGKDANIDQK